MVNQERVYILAADHRWQWEEWCAKAGLPAARISEVKGLIFEAFMQARERSPSVRRFGSLLLDIVYAAPYVERALDQGISVATPAEKAGVFPLEWGFEPFDRGLIGTLVKVLIRHRPEQPADVQEGQIAKLLALQGWCRERGKPLMVEILVEREGESEEEFEARGRPAIVAAAIRRAYARGLAPELWKLEGMPTFEGARLVDEAIRERPDCAQIILGKGAHRAAIDRWFDTAAVCPSAIGFAIGRSVFWGPCTSYLRGALAGDAAAEAMAASYIGLVEAWEHRASPVT